MWTSLLVCYCMELSSETENQIIAVWISFPMNCISKGEETKLNVTFFQNITWHSQVAGGYRESHHDFPLNTSSHIYLTHSLKPTQNFSLSLALSISLLPTHTHTHTPVRTVFQPPWSLHKIYIDLHDSEVLAKFCQDMQINSPEFNRTDQNKSVCAVSMTLQTLPR